MTSTFMLFAWAQTMLDPKNHATLISVNGLRPQMSLSFVQMGPAAAFAIKYAPPILMVLV